MEPAKSMDFDLMHEDEDVLTAERQPLCVVLNSTGTRLGVGGTSGFRVFAMRQVTTSSSSAREVDASSSTVQFVQIIQYPATAVGPDALDDSDGDFMVMDADPVATASSSKRQAPQPSGVSSSRPYCGVGAMALMSETTTLAVVGGGPSPIAPLNQILIFLGTSLTQRIVLHDAVRRVIITPWFLVALTINSLDIVALTGEKLFSVAASGNPLNLSPGPLGLHSSHRLVAFPVQHQTTVAPSAMPLASALRSNASFSTYASPSTVTSYGLRVMQYPDEAYLSAGQALCESDFDIVSSIPEAHKNPLSSICLNFDGTLVATSSEHGTLVRVWKTKDGVLLKELRSASMAAPLSQLCFVGNLYIAGQSGNRIKVFFVGEEDKVVDTRTQDVEWWENHKEFAALAKSQGSRLASLGYVCTYFSSKWAVAECELPLSIIPLSLTLKDHDTTPRRGATNAGGAAATTASSWLGYLGSWVSSAQPQQPPTSSQGGGATPRTPGHEGRTGEEMEYVPSNLEELCVVWWEHPISKYLFPSDESEGTRSRSSSRGGSSAGGGGGINHACYFYCANCDGKLTRLEFDAIKGSIRVIGPTAPIRLSSMH